MMPGLKAEWLEDKRIHFVASEHWVSWTTRLLGKGVSGALTREQELCLHKEVNLEGKILGYAQTPKQADLFYILYMFSIWDNG